MTTVPIHLLQLYNLVIPTAILVTPLRLVRDPELAPLQEWNGKLTCDCSPSCPVLSFLFKPRNTRQHIWKRSCLCCTTELKSLSRSSKWLQSVHYTCALFTCVITAPLGVANFPFANGRCHLEQSLPFPTTVDVICNIYIYGTESSCWQSGTV